MGGCREGGACLAAGASQTTGKCQCFAWPSVPLRLAPVRLLLTTEGPGNSLQREGTEPGREGQAPPSCLCLLLACPWLPHFAGLARCTKSLPRGAYRSGLMVRWRWEGKVDVAAFLFYCFVCLLKWDLRPSPCPLFSSILGLICESTSQSRPTLQGLGSPAHHPPRAS